MSENILGDITTRFKSVHALPVVDSHVKEILLSN